MPRTLAILLSVLLALYWLPTLGVAPARAATVGGFEIDGDQKTSSAVDWQTANPTVAVDPVGNADTSVFSTGSKEGIALSPGSRTGLPARQARTTSA